MENWGNFAEQYRVFRPKFVENQPFVVPWLAEEFNSLWWGVMVQFEV